MVLNRSHQSNILRPVPVFYVYLWCVRPKDVGSPGKITILSLDTVILRVLRVYVVL